MKRFITSALLVLFVAVLAACGKKTYTVTFDSAGGSNVAAVEVESGKTIYEPSAPTKADHIFLEWQLDGVKYDFTAAVTKNITLVAKWEEVPVGQLVVSFNTNGGSSVMPILVDEGTAAKAPKSPMKDYQTFEGWYSDAELTTPFDFATLITENITLHAKWKAAEYTAQNTYRTYLGNVPNMNPHSITMADASTLYSLVSGSLYSGDYDWDAMIEAGAVTEANRGDLTKVTYGGAYANTGDLPFNYFPEMATQRPRDVNGDGTLWEIKIRDDLYFTDAAKTHITAHTFEESYKLLLDPKLLNARATNLYSTDNIPLKGAEAYFKQGSDIDPDDPTKGKWPAVEWSTVGFKVVDDYTFTLELFTKKSQWNLMTWLSSAILSVVHVENYKAGLIEDGARTTYGTKENPLVSFGVYKLIEWVEEGYYVFERNDLYPAAEDYRIKYIRYDVIMDQSVAIQEFRAGRLDLADAGGVYYADYEGNPYLKESPVTTIFRFAFGTIREGGNPIVKNAKFRQAMYFAVDRETFSATVRKPSDPTFGFLGPVYHSSESNTTSYRASAAGKAVLAEYAFDDCGYDPTKAKQLFDEAYAEEVAAGRLTDGQKVVVEFAMADAETNHRMADWMSAQFAYVFGEDKFEFRKNAVTGDELTAEGTGIWDTGNFDVTFGGWQGMQFWAPGMLQVYSSVLGKKYMLEKGFNTGDAPVSVELPKGKAAVEGWAAAIEAIDEAERTEAQADYLESAQAFLAKFAEGTGTWTGKYDELWRDVYYIVLDYDNYEGKEDEMDNITAALEGELLRQMIAIPLFTNVSVVIYSSRVGFDANAFHARMGWGGLKYMYFK